MHACMSIWVLLFARLFVYAGNKTDLTFAFKKLKFTGQTTDELNREDLLYNRWGD